MSQTFGRRTIRPGTAAWAPPPAEPADTPAAKSSWKPAPDPEFEAWQAARAGTRWKTWGMAGLIVLGGPMGFLMPDGIGQWAGWGLAGAGLLGLLARFRKAPSAGA